MAYSLRKSKRLFFQWATLYQKKEKTLSPESQKILKQNLQKLKAFIQEKKRQEASDLAKSLQGKIESYFPKSEFRKFTTFLFNLLFALVVATVIRQEWFEFYKIPSGSMRPTLKEGDLVAVSKSSFSINTPLKNAPLYFDSSLMPRGAVVVFSGEGLAIADNYTRYFLLFPGIKQYVKRLIAKPGDTLYFYGGLVYGMDEEGKDLSSLRNSDWARQIEHIPFLSFEGKIKNQKEPGGGNSCIFYQMNEPVAKLYFNKLGQLESSLSPPYEGLKNYSDLWGFKNFGMVRFLLFSEKERLYPNLSVPKALFYLEIAHHPSIQKAKIYTDHYGKIRPFLSHETSLLPFTQAQVKRLKSHLFTSRFVIKNQKAYRYGLSFNSAKDYPYLPSVPPDIEEGTYEWDNGTAYRILWGSIAKKLDPSHPIYQNDPKWLSTLFNLGIEWDTLYSPSNESPFFLPSRYTYFRKGDLYLMGKPVFLQGEENLHQFLEKEISLKKAFPSYLPFKDTKAPLKEDGSLDISLIQREGLKIPERHYLVLGDNHSMSGDSRLFGFVPQQNFKGKVSFIFWPPLQRLGLLLQPTSPFLSFPNLIIWLGFSILLLLAFLYQRRRRKKILDLF